MTELPKFPKPYQTIRERRTVKIHRDGREVCANTSPGREEYRRRKVTMWERQGRICGLMIHPECKRRQGRLPKDEITFEHLLGRGGGKRDDRIEIDGKPTNCVACPWCNSLKGSRPLSAFLSDIVP